MTGILKQSVCRSELILVYVYIFVNKKSERQHCMNSLSDIAPDKYYFECKIVNIFLPINYNICFGYSKEPFH